MSCAYIGEAFLYIALLGFAYASFGVEKIGRYASNCGALAVVAAFSVLLYGFVTSDFSYLLVVNYSHTLKPMLYKVGAVWGNHEGSMLLWLLLQSLCAVWYATRKESTDTSHRLYALLNAGLCAYIVITSNPFMVSAITPVEGMDLNPVLQDPLLAIHPPILYFGSILTSILWVHYVSSALVGQAEIAQQFYRRISLIALSFITLGLTLGSFWAYYELGWGGFWFWDPVEALSLLPWLIMLSVLHQLRLQKTILWIPFGYLSVLFTTFMVRSGALTSIHSFADDPLRGQIFGIFLLVVLMLTGFAMWRQRLMVQDGIPISPPVAGLLSVKRLLMAGLIAIILIGVIYPVGMGALGKTIQLGQPYFSTTFIPLSLPLLCAVALVPWCHDKAKMAQVALVLALLTGFIALMCISYLKFPMASAAVAGLSAVVIASSCVGLWSQIKRMMHFAHFGFGLMCLGGVLSTTLNTEQTVVLHKGEKICVKGYTLNLQDTITHQRGNHRAVEYPLCIETGDHKQLGVLRPELRYYTTQNMIHAETSILNHYLDHIYVVVVEEGGQSILQIHIKPFINVMWLGLVLMVVALLGNFIRVSRR